MESTIKNPENVNVLVLLISLGNSIQLKLVKMYIYSIVIVVFPGHTHLLFWGTNYLSSLPTAMFS